MRERDNADKAKMCASDHHLCEGELFRRQTIINQLRAEIERIKVNTRHQHKVLV